MKVLNIENRLLKDAVNALPKDELTNIRLVAAKIFAKTGFPSQREEEWKYTNLRPIYDLTNDWLSKKSYFDSETLIRSCEDITKKIKNTIKANWIVIANGRVVSEWSNISDIQINKIRDNHIVDSLDKDPLAALNAALLIEGIHIKINKNIKVNSPIGIIYIDDSSKTLTQNRIILDIEEGSKIKFIEISISTGDEKQFTNSILDLNISKNAQIKHIRIQDRSENHSNINSINARINHQGKYVHHNFDFGGDITRNNVVTEILGEDAEVNLQGLFLGNKNQHIDNQTSIIHNIGPSKSTEEYRGIIGGKSKCIFNGKIYVAVGADGTDSSQSNHNLLLSESAEINTKPELEIYAEDVKCAHGATIGELDSAALFYLTTRGISKKNAKKILTKAFAEKAITNSDLNFCSDYLANRLEDQLESIVGELQ